MFNQIISICQFLLYNLPQASKVKHYLDGRLAQETQKAFEFAYFPPREHLGLLLNEVGEDVLLQTGLLYYRHYRDMQGEHKILSSNFFNNNLIMPFKNVFGDIVSIVGRTVLGEEERKELGVPKYMNTDFKKGRHLFALNEAKQTIIEKNEAFVVEGQFDCIQAFNKGIKNVVAIGSSNMSSDQLALLGRYTDNIKLLLDNDGAGEKGREKAHKKFDQYIKVKDVRLPEGYKDLDEYLVDGNLI